MKNFMGFFEVQRRVFGHCSRCHNFFRLSDAQVSQKKKFKEDWLDQLKKQEASVERAEERMWARENGVRERARRAGRLEAQRLVKRADNVFAPLKLAAQDAKPLFNPVNYLVIQGMHKFTYKGITFLDSKKPVRERTVQKSIARCVSQGKTDWVTVRVDQKGELSIQ